VRDNYLNDAYYNKKKKRQILIKTATIVARKSLGKSLGSSLVT